MGFPILSIITWSPFVAALIVMAFARHRPLLVRYVSVIGSGISLALSILLYVKYDHVANGFQFHELLPLVPSVGISYNLAVDGWGLVLTLLTAIILFAGSFASWTVKTRGQEFYALLLLLVTGVFGVFASLDLFVFFLFYEIAVLPMYLLIGVWGSSTDFGTFKRTKEYGAMKLTLVLVAGKEIFASHYVNASLGLTSLVHDEPGGRTYLVYLNRSEVDALGGLMGQAIDATGIQFKLLNRSRGPAVWSPRAQADKKVYAHWVRQALEAGGNTRFKAVELPGLNHLFQNCATGAISEYGQIEETMAPAVLRLVSEWIREQKAEN